MRRIGFLLTAIALAATLGCADPAARKAEHVQRGLDYYKAAAYEKARVELLSALQIDPKDAAARYALGQTFERLGDLRNAVGSYSAAADDPHHVESRVALARLMLLSGNVDLATQRDDEALGLAPKDAGALAVKAGIQAASGRRDLAEATANEALAVNPSESGAVALLASLYMRSGRTDEAHALLKAATTAAPSDIGLHAVYAQILLEANRVDDAVAQLEAVVRLEPDNLDYAAQLASLMASARKLDEADERLVALADRLGTAQAKLLRVAFLARYRDKAAALAALRAYSAAAPKDAELDLARAELLADTGDVAGAEAVYRKVVADGRSKKSVADARVGLASLLLHEQNVAGATGVLDDVLKDEPNDARALVLRGRIALGERRPDSAIADFRTTLRDAPNSIPVHLLLASAYRESGQGPLAEETLANAARLAPTDPAVRRDLLALAFDSREWDLADAQINALEGLGMPAANILDLRCRVALGRGHYESALALAEKLEQDAAMKATAQFYRGAASEALGRKQDAEAAFHASADARPGAIEPLGALVRLYLSENRRDDARRALTAAIERVPKNAGAFNLLGEVELSAGRLAEAASAFERAIELDPKSWLPYRGLAAVDLAKKDVGVAEETLNRGIDATGEPRLYVELGLLLGVGGRNEDAIALYERGLVAHPTDAVLANNLAMLLVTVRSDRASLDRALALVGALSGTDDPALLDTIGWVNYKAGNLGLARSSLEQAVAKLPSAPLLHYHLAQVLADAGDSAAATAAVDEALKRGDFSEAAAARALRQRLVRGS